MNNLISGNYKKGYINKTIRKLNSDLILDLIIYIGVLIIYKKITLIIMIWLILLINIYLFILLLIFEKILLKYILKLY